MKAYAYCSSCFGKLGLRLGERVTREKVLDLTLKYPQLFYSTCFTCKSTGELCEHNFGKSIVHCIHGQTTVHD